jgi:hypothetical protein
MEKNTFYSNDFCVEFVACSKYKNVRLYLRLLLLATINFISTYPMLQKHYKTIAIFLFALTMKIYGNRKQNIIIPK